MLGSREPPYFDGSGSRLQLPKKHGSQRLPAPAPAPKPWFAFLDWNWIAEVFALIRVTTFPLCIIGFRLVIIYEQGLFYSLVSATLVNDLDSYMDFVFNKSQRNILSYWYFLLGVLSSNPKKTYSFNTFFLLFPDFVSKNNYSVLINCFFKSSEKWDTYNLMAKVH